MRRRTVQDPRDVSTRKTGPAVRGTVAKVAAALAMCAAGLALAAGPAQAGAAVPAQGQDEPCAGVVSVVEVDGLLDDVLVDFIEEEVRGAAGQCALVLQLDSGGATVSAERMDDLIATIDSADLGDVDVGDRVGAERAVDLGLVDNDAPVIGDFVIRLPGVESEAAEGGRRPVTEVRFSSID